MNLSTIPFHKDFSDTCRSIYLSSGQITSILNAYLDLSDQEFSERIKTKMSAKFENQLKAFCCTRDAIVLSTLADSVADRSQVEAYANHLVELEEDYDIRLLRVTLFQGLSKPH